MRSGNPDLIFTLSEIHLIPPFFKGGDCFRFSISKKVFCFFLISIFFSSALFAQPEKKIVFIKPDAIQTFSENELRLLDSVFKVTLSSENQFPSVSSVFYENDSVWVMLKNANDRIDRVAIAPSNDPALPYLWIVTAGGTLTLFILLYFIRF
ncbi:MAG: hypothetical protein LCH54_03250 [Bacteroidetes bacterium]|nr:hypothetical protein [Bacteroidota bacterium]